MTQTRCAWVGDDPLMITYHDTEWGTPIHNDRLLFEFLVLEGAQAGLSWSTILQRREGYRQAFAHFDPHKVARFGDAQTAKLLQNPGIIRNRFKIAAAINNAQRFLEVQKEFGSFDAYQWQFVGGKPKNNRWANTKQVPAVTDEATAFSNDVKRRGVSFVGPTIIYAHMQAVGMVNDHTTDCFRYAQLTA